MLLKAKIKWSNESVLIKPVLFSWHVGLQYKVMTGYGAASIFCCGKKDFIFPPQTKFILLFIKLWYWTKMYLWKQIRYWIPKRVKLYFNNPNNDLPF